MKKEFENPTVEVISMNTESIMLGNGGETMWEEES